MTRQATAILFKDLLLERRSKAGLNALLLLGGLILVIVSFALGPSPARLRAASAGVLWVAFAFAGILAFARAYQAESDNRCFEGMILAGASPSAIYVAKLLSTMAVMLAVEAPVFLAMVALYGLDIRPAAFLLLPVAVLGTAGFASVGALYGRLTMSMRAREVLLPLLVLPVVVPVLLASVRASALILTGATDGLGLWFEVLAAFDAVFIAAGLLVYGSLAGE